MSHGINVQFALPGKRFYAIKARFVFEDHDEVTSVSLQIDDLAVLAHRLDIQHS